VGEQFKTLGELENEITLNLRRLQAEPQDRNKYGKLESPLAEMFEVRMNRALDNWNDIYKWTGSAALLGETA
jgi:hypothetical protein